MANNVCKIVAIVGISLGGLVCRWFKDCKRFSVDTNCLIGLWIAIAIIRCMCVGTSVLGSCCCCCCNGYEGRRRNRQSYAPNNGYRSQPDPFDTSVPNSNFPPPIPKAKASDYEMGYVGDVGDEMPKTRWERDENDRYYKVEVDNTKNMEMEEYEDRHDNEEEPIFHQLPPSQRPGRNVSFGNVEVVPDTFSPVPVHPPPGGSGMGMGMGMGGPPPRDRMRSPAMNGMAPNGMAPNGMAPNGMAPNGMAPNGMPSHGQRFPSNSSNGSFGPRYDQPRPYSPNNNYGPPQQANRPPAQQNQFPSPRPFQQYSSPRGPPQDRQNNPPYRQFPSPSPSANQRNIQPPPANQHNNMPAPEQEHESYSAPSGRPAPPYPDHSPSSFI